MERAEYPLEWAKQGIADLTPMPWWPKARDARTVRAMVDGLYDGGWAALERTALADWDAGCR